MIPGMLGIAALFLLIFVVMLLRGTIRVQRGQAPTLRQIRAFETLKGLASRSIEAGRGLHLSLGIGGINTETTADSLAGLIILDHLSEQAAVTGVAPTVTMADPTVMMLAQTRLQAAHQDNPDRIEEAHKNIRWIAPQGAAYAAGVMSLIETEQPEANILVGNFGDEYLLMGETAARQGTSHIGGTSDPNTLAFVYASAEETLLGEEIYAAGAYLQKKPNHLGSLMAQDTMRSLVAWAIVIGIIVLTVS
ncbi:MAG: DUF6754 domain-containing protein [Anaerolineae bacterium]|nr:DUF6754 domain-containing protein [Anaerolineae bacterium]